MKLHQLTQKQKEIEDELNKLKNNTNRSRSPVKIIPSSPTKPIVVLNKIPDARQKTIPTLRRKRCDSPTELFEVQVENHSQIEVESHSKIQVEEVEFLDASAESGREDEVEKPLSFIVIPQQFEIISDEKVEVPKAYCRMIAENEQTEMDENGEKKIFQCAFENCDEKFSRRQQCKTHFYNHFAVDSQFSCKFCAKKFKVASALERHERVHTNSKPFKVSFEIKIVDPK